MLLDGSVNCKDTSVASGSWRGDRELSKGQLLRTLSSRLLV